MKLFQLFIVLFALGWTSCYAGKHHTLEIEVKEPDKHQPLENIQLTIEFNRSASEVVYTNASGRITLSWEGKIKSIIVRAVDTSGIYRSTTEYIYKDELKQEHIKRTVYMGVVPDYDVMLAKFRKQDEEKLQEILDMGLDTAFRLGDQCEESSIADFPNGAAELQRWINMNLMYPQQAIEDGEQGRVYLSFIIEPDGSVTHVVIERGITDALDYEAARLVYSMPKWTPSTCNGVPVRTRCRLPIVFTLE